MSRKKSLKAKMDLHSLITEYCRDCVARLVKSRGSLESVIAACLDSAKRKYFPKAPQKL